jgi:CRISPR/Cas system CSM-associated protein Csm2 small subunit
MLNLFDIETKIKQNLESINDFQIVYDYHTLDTTWYPYSSFELNNFDWNALDSCNDEITLEFWIIVYQETKNLGRQQAKIKLYNILEKIIEKFRKDSDLGWDVTGLVFLRWDFWTYEGKEWEVMFLQIFLQFKTILFIK